MAELDEHAYECRCGWLESAASDPHVPVVFDAELNEYHIVRGGELGGYMMIYYCPSCGGAPPLSRRPSLFVHVTHEEQLRLNELTKNTKTMADVIAAFGQPDHDFPDGYSETTPEKDGEPPRTVVYRVLRYENLSLTAVVDAVVRHDERVSFMFTPKPVAQHKG